MFAYFRFPLIFISATSGPPREFSKNFLKDDFFFFSIDFTCIVLRLNQKVEMKVSLAVIPDTIGHFKRSIIMFEKKRKRLITGESKEHSSGSLEMAFPVSPLIGEKELR